MGVVLGSLEALNAADLGEGDAVRLAVALLGGVEEAELKGVHVQMLADLVDERFGGELGHRGAWGAVGLHLGLVDHHVVAVHEDVIDAVGGEHVGGAGGDLRARGKRRPHR